jgi:hypothetical protein
MTHPLPALSAGVSGETDMPVLTFPDGAGRSYDAGVSSLDVA